MIRYPVTLQCLECGGCSEFGERLAQPPNKITLFLPGGWKARGATDPVPSLYCSKECLGAADARERLQASQPRRREPIRRPSLQGGLDISDLISDVASGPMATRPLEYEVIEVAEVEGRRIDSTPPKE